MVGGGGGAARLQARVQLCVEMDWTRRRWGRMARAAAVALHGALLSAEAPWVEAQAAGTDAAGVAGMPFLVEQSAPPARHRQTMAWHGNNAYPGCPVVRRRLVLTDHGCAAVDGLGDPLPPKALQIKIGIRKGTRAGIAQN